MNPSSAAVFVEKVQRHSWPEYRTASGGRKHAITATAKTDFCPGTDSLGFGGGPDSNAPSFSQQAPTVDLERTGAGNPRQRGISLCSWASATPQETSDDSRLE